MKKLIIKNIKCYFIYSLYLLLCSSFTLSAQNNVGCLSKFQILKMQKTTLEGIRSFLTENGWSFDGAKTNQTFNYFDYSLNYNIVQWGKNDYYNSEKVILYHSLNKSNIIILQASQYCFNALQDVFSNENKGLTTIEDNLLTTLYNEGNITIEFRIYKNDNTARQFSVLVYNTVSFKREIEYEKQKELELIKVQAKKDEDYLNAISEGDRFFNLRNYNEAKIKYNTANSINNNNIILNKIEECDNIIFKQIINDGDFQLSLNNFEAARLLYTNGKDFSVLNNLIQEKLTIAEDKIREVNIIEKLKIAGDYFLKNNFDAALTFYSDVLKYDQDNIIALEEIKKIKEINDLLNNRKTTIFSYKKTNYENFNQFQNKLNTNLNEIISSNKNGLLNFDYKIEFDLNGINKSKIITINYSDKKFEEYLYQTLKTDFLLPSKKYIYFVQSSEIIKMDLKWNTTIVNFKSSSRGIYTPKQIDINDYALISNYINRQNFKYGKYKFEIKSKSANNKLASDIKLKNYKTGAGPICVLYSMLMPGIGTLKVTHGEKGWGRLTWFLISSSIAASSKLYSDKQFKNYLSATSQSDIDSYYLNANLSHKLSLIAGGVSASIYLYDIIWVFSKGVKNQIESKHLRKRVRNNPIVIQNQAISFE